VVLQQHDRAKNERGPRLSFAFLAWMSDEVPLALFLQAVLASRPGDLLPVIETAGALSFGYFSEVRPFWAQAVERGSRASGWMT
jgi:hypothetical protein